MLFFVLEASCDIGCSCGRFDAEFVDDSHLRPSLRCKMVRAVGLYSHSSPFAYVLSAVPSGPSFATRKDTSFGTNESVTLRFEKHESV